MGTRGIVILKYKNKVYTFYSSSDAFLDTDGINVYSFLLNHINNLEYVYQLIENLKVVSMDDENVGFTDLGRILENGIYNHIDEDVEIKYFPFNICCDNAYFVDFDVEIFSIYNSKAYLKNYVPNKPLEYAIPFCALSHKHLDLLKENINPAILHMKILVIRTDYLQLSLMYKIRQNQYANRIIRFFKRITKQKNMELIFVDYPHQRTIVNKNASKDDVLKCIYAISQNTNNEEIDVNQIFFSAVRDTCLTENAIMTQSDIFDFLNFDRSKGPLDCTEEEFVAYWNLWQPSISKENIAREHNIIQTANRFIMNFKKYELFIYNL